MLNQSIDQSFECPRTGLPPFAPSPAPQLALGFPPPLTPLFPFPPTPPDPPTPQMPQSCEDCLANAAFVIVTASAPAIMIPATAAINIIEVFLFIL